MAEKIAESSEKMSATEEFVPLFQLSSTGKARGEEESDENHPLQSEEALGDELKKKLKRIEERERTIRTILRQLEKSYELLLKREKQLNEKEETLNREYLKILELESLYKGMDKFSDSLNSVLPSLDTSELDIKEAEARLLKEDYKP